ncbi:Uma2 family endonuclease [bacterium]|nr:Uma2 family endonuclease [bacterium]
MESLQILADLPKRETNHLEQNIRLTHEVAWLFPRQGEWTEVDYFRLPDTNHFVELSEGRLVIPEMPTNSHQYAVGELFVEMRASVRNNVLGEVRIAPLPVKLWQGKIREPDIVFMSTKHADRIGEDFWGVPDIVVEVLSKSTMKTDRGEKFLEYAQAGVTEYWIVDLEERAIEVYVLRQGAYKLLGNWGMGQIARSEVFSGFEVAVDTVIGE